MTRDESDRSGPKELDAEDGDQAKTVDFSVVVPVFNSQNSLKELHQRLVKTFTSMGKTFEIIFVDDASRDGSLAVLRSLYEANRDTVKVIALYRNHGQQVALMSGFRFCSGEVIVTIDDDLQHSPEDIPALYDTLRQAQDVVIGSYIEKSHGRLRNLGSIFVRWLNQRIFQTPPELRLSSYRLIRKDIVRYLLSFRTSFPYISGMIFSATSQVANVQVSHEPRRHGRSGYTLSKLVKLSYNLLINYSALPLRFIGGVGMLASLVAFVAGAAFLIRQVATDGAPQGWTSLIVLLSFFSGIICAMLVVMTEYVSRLLTEAATRPNSPIRKVWK